MLQKLEMETQRSGTLSKPADPLIEPENLTQNETRTEARRSSNNRLPTQQNVPSIMGKKYSYAAMQLDRMKYDHLFAIMEENEFYFDSRIVKFVFDQLTIKAAMRLWGNETMAAAAKEMKQLHWRKSLSVEQRKTVQE